jgi:hypothetical protein
MTSRLLIAAALLAQTAAPPPAPRIDVRPLVPARQNRVPEKVRVAPSPDVEAFTLLREDVPVLSEDAITFQGRFLPMPFGLPDNQPVDLDLENVTVQDAARQIVERSKVKADVVVDPDVSADTRITLRVRGVRPSTALDLVAQSARVNWGVERRDDKTTVRLGKSVHPGMMFRQDVIQRFPAIAPGAGVLTVPQFNVNRDIRMFTTQRSTFMCPHCKGQATVLRQSAPPQCPKCNRLFQADWQFCPADGTKRPAQSSDWKFCPLCGKRVDIEKSGLRKDTEGEGVPILKDLPHIGNLFRKKPVPMVPLEGADTMLFFEPGWMY